ncbi:phosphotransferase [Streptomyces sp. NPDC048258]|uniref:phosphotransferase n=1 Tax=Streptomyces sp. NPDC048258 TaxID=3365527 RepID=UPI00371E0341
MPLALDVLAQVPTRREAVREEYLRRVIPQFTGHSIGEVQWSTAHGDFHWANLAGPDLLVLDWEDWGTAPVGFDAATLYIYALQAPKTAARVRRSLAHILDDPAARVAELLVCAQVLQAADRTSFYATLAEPVRCHLQTLASRSA